MNCWSSPPCWSLIFCKTYKFLCNMWCVMCDAWCVMFRTWFFVRSWLYELWRDQKHPIWMFSDLFMIFQNRSQVAEYVHDILQGLLGLYFTVFKEFISNIRLLKMICCTLLYWTLLYFTFLYCAALQFSVLYCILLYCTAVLYNTIL